MCYTTEFKEKKDGPKSPCGYGQSQGRVMQNGPAFMDAHGS